MMIPHISRSVRCAPLHDDQPGSTGSGPKTNWTGMFQDRRDAGRKLATRLNHYAGRDDVTVLALPRGGVPVAFEVAESLDVPLDVFVVRKLGVPGQEELAMGAIATGGALVLNEDVVRHLQISDAMIDEAAAREQQELVRREQLYRNHRPSPVLNNRTVIVVDDGLATGATMQAAAKALKSHQPAHIVVAVPVAATSTLNTLRPQVDELVCFAAPEPFYAVGQWYHDFRQTTDDEVRDLLERAYQRQQQAVRQPPSQ